MEFQYGSMQMNTPQIENLGDGGEPDRGIVPIYALTDGVSQFVLRSSVRNWFRLIMSYQRFCLLKFVKDINI